MKLVVEWQPSHGVGGVPTGNWCGGAIRRSSFDEGVGVTGRAGQVAVLADELEAGRQMVEVQARRRGGKALRHEREKQQRREHGRTRAAGLPPDPLMRYGCPDTHASS